MTGILLDCTTVSSVGATSHVYYAEDMASLFQFMLWPVQLDCVPDKICNRKIILELKVCTLHEICGKL